MEFHEWFLDQYKEVICSYENGIVEFNQGFPKLLNCMKKMTPTAGPSIYRKYWNGKYFEESNWRVNKEIFIAGWLQFQGEQEEAIEKWNAQVDIFKIFHLLRYIFGRNMLAHNQSSRSRRSNFFGQKSKSLVEVLDLAKTILLPFFSFGIGYDLATMNFPILYYFQFGDFQLSFHADFEEDVPKFKGEWNGIINEEFPFSLVELRSLLKKYNILEKDLPKTERIVLRKRSRDQLEEDLKNRELKAETKVIPVLPIASKNPSFRDLRSFIKIQK
jgi:hypothetical protein